MALKVVVVGAGFAGIECAQRLARAPLEVTIVDRHNFHTFQPLLYQVATAGLAPSDVAYPVRGLFRGAPNVSFRCGNVTGVDWGERRLLLDGGELPWDRLVLAVGASTSWYGVPGAEEHSLPLYGVEDAVQLRNHLLSCFEAADADPSLVEEGILTSVVVGGGPTGVEVSGALGELVHGVLARDYRHLDMAAARIILVEMADTVLGPFSATARSHAVTELERRGVELRLEERVAAVSDGQVELTSGEQVRCGTVIWAAGVQACPLASALGLPQTSAGRIVVDATLQVQDRPGVYAVGDVAAISRPGGGLLPQLAPVAKQSGRHAAEAIVRELDGHRPRPFHYRDKGSMATIGRRAAVADLPRGIRLTGTLGWLAWLFLHLLYLVGIRNRLAVLLNWVWSYLVYDRGPRIILGRSRRPPGRTAG